MDCITGDGSMLGAGVRDRLPSLLDSLHARKVLLVGSNRAVHHAGIAQLLSGFQTHRFSAFTPNPTIEQALECSRVRVWYQPDAIVAVGGGSSIDMGKLASALAAERSAALRQLAGAHAGLVSVPVVALPTTAGSGSEVTSFATVYVDDKKRSLDSPHLRPLNFLYDSDLLATCKKEVAHAPAFDALCHAVESYWSTGSVARSRELACSALRLLLPSLRDGFQFDDPAFRKRVALAANLAGRAIAISRTTAAHGCAYGLTMRYGLPHGIAALVNLTWLFDYNIQKWPSHTIDRRGVEFVRRRMFYLERMIGEFASNGSPADFFRMLLAREGYPQSVRDISADTRKLACVISDGLHSQRAGLNPVHLDAGSLQFALR